MPWRVQTEDCDELINEYLKRGNFDTTNKELRRMMKEYMMRSKYSLLIEVIMDSALEAMSE